MTDGKLGTRSNPITHDGPDRGYKYCRCARCGRVAKCTPAWDFYVCLRYDEGGLLKCEICVTINDPLPGARPLASA